MTNKKYDSVYSICLDILKKMKGGTVINNQDITKTITANGTQTFTADPGYTGLGNVTVDVNVPSSAKLQEATLAVWENHKKYEITPDAEHNGISKAFVDVNVPDPTLQEVSTTITTNGLTTITADPGMYGISKANVTVSVPEPYLIPLNVTENGTYNPEPDTDGFNSVVVDVPSDKKPEEVGNETIIKNGKVKFTPTAGSVYSEMNVDVQVPIPTFETEELTATENKVYTPTKDGYSKVTVAVPQSKLEENKTLDITNNGSYTMTPSQDFDAIKMGTIHVNVPTEGSGKLKLADFPGMKLGYSDISLESFNNIDFTGVTNFKNMFSHCEAYADGSALINVPSLGDVHPTNCVDMFGFIENLQTITPFDTSACTDFTDMFTECHNLKTAPPLDFTKVNYLVNVFLQCFNLESMPEYDFSNITNGIDNFTTYDSSMMLEKLTDVGGFKGLKIDWTNAGCPANWPNLTKQSVLNIINDLADVKSLGETHTIKFHANSLALLSDEEKLIATNKGWNLVS